VEPIANDLLPTVNVLHLHKNPAVTTDTDSLNAIDCGENTALLLARPDSLVADVDGMKTKDTIHTSHYALTKKAVYLNELMPAVDPSRSFANRQYRHHHSRLSLPPII
jgi:hypothetical protein